MTKKAHKGEIIGARKIVEAHKARALALIEALKVQIETNSAQPCRDYCEGSALGYVLEQLEEAASFYGVPGAKPQR